MSLYEDYKAECQGCDVCKKEGLLHEAARPLFMHWEPRRTDVLFVLEAPNDDDTTNPAKGYITVDDKTDQTGKFLHWLVKHKLGWKTDPDLFITNSVLCLPKKKGKSFPVGAAQRDHCFIRLLTLIHLLKPRLVCTLGVHPLKAFKNMLPLDFKLSKDTVAKAVEWNGRLLFPLYHPGRQGRNGPDGRNEEAQKADWAALKTLIDSMERT
jgi:uracil-DNA glycosylase family 4